MVFFRIVNESSIALLLEYQMPRRLAPFQSGLIVRRLPVKAHYRASAMTTTMMTEQDLCLAVAGAGVKMEQFQTTLDPRKQELLEARFLGAKVSAHFLASRFSTCSSKFLNDKSRYGSNYNFCDFILAKLNFLL